MKQSSMILCLLSILIAGLTLPASAVTWLSPGPREMYVPLPVEFVSSVPRDHGPSSKQIVPYDGNQPPGTIIISNSNRTLDFVLTGGKAERYTISVGRDGFTWTGVTTVGSKKEWPDWRPPSEMRKREPSLPEMVPAGPFNPLGARAIYLYKGGRDTLYRIHGTNNAATIGGYETSGCFRLSNSDVLELYEKIRIGSKVIVN